MKYSEILYPIEKALSLKVFRKMDYTAVNEYYLPIELMMENAGYQLASFVSKNVSKTKTIKIGVGNGNNGGGGLVAARRLAAWGYNVYIDPFTKIEKPIPTMQLKRALAFGAIVKETSDPDIWIDAYLGFSQQLPLDERLISRINQANSSKALKISLDIPTGYLGDINHLYFEPDSVISLAAPKKILYDLPKKTELYIADLGIPYKVYQMFKVEMLPFEKGSILKLKR